MVEKTIELTGTSANSIEDAVRLAVSRAGVTISGLQTAQVINIAASIEDKQVASWRVTVKLSFTVQDELHE